MLFSCTVRRLLCYQIIDCVMTLKMLGLYLYTLKIGQKSCNMLSILKKLLLQKELQTLWQIMYFWTKSKNSSSTKQKKSNIKTLAGAGNWTRDLLHPKRCVTTAPPSQLRVSIVVKLFKCFDAMGRNVNKQSRICGPHIFNKFIFFCNILHAWITIFGSFSYLRE